MAKDKTPDLMGELLGSRKAGVPESKKTITPEQQKARTPEHHNMALKKATFYLPTDLLNLLERIWLERRAGGGRMSKSQIVAEILRKYLD